MRAVLAHDKLVVVRWLLPDMCLHIPTALGDWNIFGWVSWPLIESFTIFGIEVHLTSSVHTLSILTVLLAVLLTALLGISYGSLGLGISEVVGGLENILSSLGSLIQKLFTSLHGFVNNLELSFPLVRYSKPWNSGSVNLTRLLVVDVSPDVVVKVSLVDVHFVVVGHISFSLVHLVLELGQVLSLHFLHMSVLELLFLVILGDGIVDELFFLVKLVVFHISLEIVSFVHLHFQELVVVRLHLISLHLLLILVLEVSSHLLLSWEIDDSMLEVLFLFLDVAVEVVIVVLDSSVLAVTISDFLEEICSLVIPSFGDILLFLSVDLIKFLFSLSLDAFEFFC